jgi:hypothetical protein
LCVYSDRHHSAILVSGPGPALRWRVGSAIVPSRVQPRGQHTPPLLPSNAGRALVLQWGFSGVTVVLQWCYSGVTVVLQWLQSGVTVVSQWFTAVLPPISAVLAPLFPFHACKNPCCCPKSWKKAFVPALSAAGSCLPTREP